MVIGACSLLMTLKTVHAILASNSDYGEFFFFVKDKTKATLIYTTTWENYKPFEGSSINK